MRSASANASATTFGGGHDAVDQPELQRPFGGDRVAGQRELERHRERHPLREADEPAGGRYQPALDLGNAEHGRVGRDDEVA